MFVLLVAHYHHSMHRASEMSDKAWRRIFRPLHWNKERVELFIACCQAVPAIAPAAHSSAARSAAWRASAEKSVAPRTVRFIVRSP